MFFNLRSGEFNTRGSSPALDEICLLHFCGSLLSIRDVLLKWAKYLFWYWVTPQAPALQLSTIAMVAIIKDSRLLCCVRRGKRGDLLRFVPCVTVWHQKIKINILWAREKMKKVHLVYVSRMTKNYVGHLPDLWYLYETHLKYLGCHTVTWNLKIHYEGKKTQKCKL